MFWRCFVTKKFLVDEAVAGKKVALIVNYSSLKTAMKTLFVTNQQFW